MLPRSRRRRRRRLLLLGIVVLLAAGAGGAYALLKSRTGDISHPGAEFDPGAAPRPRPRPRPAAFFWPNYGYTKAHTRFFEAPANLRPPYRQAWRIQGATLLEFPPSIAYGRLFQLNDGGTLRGISARTGRVLWRAQVGHLAASTPAVGGGLVYATVLERARGAAGRIVAVDATTGRIRWRRDLPSRAESSPLLDAGHVYFGSEDGTVYSLRASDGSVRWKYHASGAVKGSPTLRDGVLYFGDYGGEVHAVYEQSGRKRWSTGTSGGALGFKSGTFYATPSVMFGRVYLGNTDGRMYSFVARSGKLAWAKQTGNYVYASAPVADIAGLGPTVYVGSYDGTFYALDAKSGNTRWTHNAGGKISGGSTIVGNIVYFANLAARSTTGLDVRTGRAVFHFDKGGFDPVVSDGRRIYLTGYTSLYALEPRRRPGARNAGPRRARPVKSAAR